MVIHRPICLIVFNGPSLIHFFTGIPTIQAVPLRPDLGRNYLKRRAANATAVWDHVRAHKPDYKEDLPADRIHLGRK